MAHEICDRILERQPLSRKEVEDHLAKERESLDDNISPQRRKVVDTFMNAMQGENGSFAMIVRLIEEASSE
jgi:hypothetical protein